MTATSIYQWARTQPESPALIWCDNPLSYATFWRMIEGARSFFAAQNLPVGGTAIVLIHQLAHAWVTVMGLRAAGLNTISVVSTAEAEKLAIKHVVCIVLSPVELQLFPSFDNAFAGIKVITIPHTVFANARSGELIFNQQNNTPFGGHILYTSGTTGTNKKVMVTGVSQVPRDIARAHTWSFNTHTVYHGIDFPLWTGAGFKQPSAVWHAGGCVVFDQRKDRFNHFFRQQITSATLVPVMLKTLLAATPDNGLAPHEFAMVFGAGFLPLNLAEKAMRQLTRKIEIQYGATELGLAALVSHFNSLDDLQWMMLGDGCAVQIVDENGTECAVGQEGKLRVLLTEVDSTSYLDDAETSAKFFRDGFFYPGDLAVKRADGRIRILGRTADVLNLHGTKIAVAPLEEKIQRHLGVDEVCLFAGLNDTGAEELVIAIQSGRELNRADLEAVNREFPLFEQVRFVVLEQFPRSDTGMRKTQRSELRRRVFSRTV